MTGSQQRCKPKYAFLQLHRRYDAFLREWHGMAEKKNLFLFTYYQVYHFKVL